jgi:hypothetical protein
MELEPPLSAEPDLARLAVVVNPIIPRNEPTPMCLKKMFSTRNSLKVPSGRKSAVCSSV